MKYLLAYIIIVNIYGLALMYSDKDKSRKGKWRVPEKKLFLIAILLGSPSILLGMQLFRHKTKHWKFVLGIPMIMILQLFAAYKLYIFFG